MKKIILISDSHGAKNRLEEVLQEEKYDYIFYLGDGLKDIEMCIEPEKIIKVAGNCDLFSTEAKERVVVIENIKFLLTHGHNYKVKWGLGALINAASKRGINVVCFGHTHHFLIDTIDGITYVNPGSFFSGSYAIMEVMDDHIINIIKRG